VLNLMKIDIKKFNLKKLPLYFLIALIPIGLMSLVMAMTAESLVGSISEAVAIIVRPVFIIWQGVLINKIIIDEFKSKNILMLYTYPVAKRKLLIAKTLLVVGYSLLGIIGTQLILSILFGGLSLIIPSIPFALSIGQMFSYLVASAMVIMLGLIPLAVGLMTYSGVATVVTSLVIVLMGSSSGLGFDQLLSEIWFLVGLAVTGIVAAISTITYTLKKDTIV
jgi:hypothetical protein